MKVLHNRPTTEKCQHLNTVHNQLTSGWGQHPYCPEWSWQHVWPSGHADWSGQTTLSTLHRNTCTRLTLLWSQTIIVLMIRQCALHCRAHLCMPALDSTLSNHNCSVTTDKASYSHQILHTYSMHIICWILHGFLDHITQLYFDLYTTTTSTTNWNDNNNRAHWHSRHTSKQIVPKLCSIKLPQKCKIPRNCNIHSLKKKKIK